MTDPRAAEFGLNPKSMEAIRLHEEGERRARADETPERAAKWEGLRAELQDEMDGALGGVWAEYPRECEEALDAVMKVIERRFGDA